MMRIAGISASRRHQINGTRTMPQCLTKISELRYFQPTPCGELQVNMKKTFSQEEVILGGPPLQVTYLHVQKNDHSHMHKG